MTPRRKRWLFGVGAAALVGVAWIAQRAVLPPRFPRPAEIAWPAAPPATMEVRAAARSLPGLKTTVPQAALDTGDVRGGFSPSLSADLKTIVFAGWKGHDTEYDLYEASRESVEKPFGAPRRLEACVTPWTEAFATLSADALELVFTSSNDAAPDEMPRLMRSTRWSRAEAFSKPEALTFPGVDGKSVRQWCPQLIDDKRLKFWLIPGTGERSIVVATRAHARAPFGKPEVLPFDDRLTVWFMTRDARRAYAGNESGIYLSERGDADAKFGVPKLLLKASEIGAVEGPIWIAPGDDAVFYCSPGLDKKAGMNRRLWVVAF